MTMHMQSPLPMRAAIDIGSNTIHIVVARCTPHDLEIVEDQQELVRIGVEFPQFVCFSDKPDPSFVVWLDLPCHLRVCD